MHGRRPVSPGGEYPPGVLICGYVIHRLSGDGRIGGWLVSVGNGIKIIIVAPNVPIVSPIVPIPPNGAPNVLTIQGWG